MKLDGKTKFDFTVKSLVLATKGTYHCTEDEACNALHKVLNNRHIMNEIADKVEDTERRCKKMRDYWSPYDELYGNTDTENDTSYLDEEEYPTSDRDYEEMD